MKKNVKNNNTEIHYEMMKKKFSINYNSNKLIIISHPQ